MENQVFLEWSLLKSGEAAASYMDELSLLLQDLAIVSIFQLIPE